MQKYFLLALKYAERSKSNPEVIRYVIVGILSNTIGYLSYLIATMLLGFGHKTAMTGLYVASSIINFYVNRRWTFCGGGSVGNSLARFVLAIVLGYFLNLVWLYIFVDWMGWPHALVQAAAIVVISIYFFVINKYYVHAA